MTNLVVGATGTLGGEIARLLLERGKPVRAMARATSDPAKVVRLRELGAEVVEGDLRDPRSLVAACEGARVVVSGATAILSEHDGDTIEAVDRDGHLNLVETAARAGVERFLYISFAELTPTFALQDAKRAVEDRLRATGMLSTVLRPTNFMESWLGPALGWDIPNGRAQICGSGQNAVSWISFRDVARVAADALDDPAAGNAVLNFGGPEALSPLDVVRIMEEETGRRFEVAHVPEEALRAQKEAASDSRADTFAGLMLATAGGFTADPPPRTGGLASVRDYVREAAHR
jgi:NADH dehydrogenase